MAILPRYKRLRRRDWKDPFSWFNWHQQNKKDPVFLYRPESGRTGMIGFTATRADSTTCARYRDSSGIWQTAAANVLRDAHYHYDGTSQYRTLLREGASTNSALGSCSYSDATYWTNSGGLVVAAVTSCISGQTAYKHTGNSVANSNRNQAVGTFVNGQTDCLSVILENVDATASRIYFFDNTAVGVLVGVTLTWATKSSAIVLGSGTTGVIDLGTGPNGGAMVRVYVTGTGTAAGTGAAGNTRGYFIYTSGTTANTQAAILHHAQFEAATEVPSSPIVTVGSAVTRAADLISVAWPYAPQAMTVYVDAYNLTLTSASNAFEIGGSGGANPRVSSYRSGGGWVSRYTGTGNSISTAAATPAYGDRAEVRSVYAVSGANVTATNGQSINSGTEAVAAAGGAIALDASYTATPRLYIGSLYNGTNPANLAIRSICIVLGNEQSMANLRLIARG